MNSKIFTREKAVRVKIDQPSTNQILHKLNGKINGRRKVYGKSDGYSDSCS